MKNFISLIYGVILPSLGIFLMSAYYYLFFYTEKFVPNTTGTAIVLGLGLISLAIAFVWWAYIVPFNKAIEKEGDVLVLKEGHKLYADVLHNCMWNMTRLDANAYGQVYVDYNDKYYYLSSTGTIYIGDELHLLLEKASEDEVSHLMTV